MTEKVEIVAPRSAADDMQGNPSEWAQPWRGKFEKWYGGRTVIGVTVGPKISDAYVTNKATGESTHLAYTIELEDE